MIHPELYNNNNTVQRKEASEFLNEYATKIKWKRFGDRAIDIGCADGSLTANILARYLPHNYEKLIGCDISKEMIKYANKHHSNKRTTFRILDIGDELPMELKGEFDHVFSFYCLQWIPNQKKVFQNIFDMLTKDGDCLLMFAVNSPLYDAYRKVAQNPKWHPWLQNAEQYVTPYQDSREPIKEVEHLMSDIGFSNIEIKCEEKEHIFYDIDKYKDTLLAVNPFNIPTNRYDEYVNDFLNTMRDIKQLNNFGDTTTALITVTTVFIYASKGS